MAKKKLTRVQAARRRDKRLMWFGLAIFFIPVVLMLLGIGTPGRAFN